MEKFTVRVDREEGGKSEEIFTQTVEDLDLDLVIAAVNGWKQNPEKRRRRRKKTQANA